MTLLRQASNRIRQTSQHKHLALLRILAGLPLLLFGVLHLLNPEPFRSILVASSIPFVELNLVLAPLAEVLAGALLFSGYLSRIGGLLGIGTMVTAIYSTLVLASLDLTELPTGLAAVPEVPPLVLPAVVLLASAYVTWRGAGAWSLDQRFAVGRFSQSG